MNPLSNQEQDVLLSQFPKNIKLSYEKIIHNKVYESIPLNTKDLELFMAIPKGKKSFFWFYQKNIYSLTLSLNRETQNKIECIQKVNDLWNEDFSVFEGSIFYGTLIFISFLKKQSICIEDVFYYKNKNVCHEFYMNKLGIIRDCVTSLSDHSTKIIWGVPILSKSYHDVLEKIKELEGRMNIYCILIRPLKENKPLNKILYTNSNVQMQGPTQMQGQGPMQGPTQIQNPFKINIKSLHCNLPNSFPKTKIFSVKPDLQNDIYHLYNENQYIEVAYIPNYKTSVMMNHIFRKIKENDNLDALEESDDEEEFENDKEDRFVYLDKIMKMECHYHPKFKKWVPSRVI